jgi:hypothetical protein
MRPGSSFTNFVTDGNVRQNAQDFNPELYNKVGAIKGYPGPDTGVAAAAGDPGPLLIPIPAKKGGSRAPAPGPDYLSFTDSADVRAGIYGRNYAPVTKCNNNMCGGRKTRKYKVTKHKGKGKKMHRVTKHKAKKMHRATKHKATMKKHKGTLKAMMARKSSKAKRMLKQLRKRAKSRKYLSDVRDLYRMNGGSPAPVPEGTQSNGYHQYMSNQPYTPSYSAGGELAPAENALANPVLIQRTDNCPDLR